MKTREFFLLAILGLACAAWVAPAEAQQLYRWVDENGVVHFGDAIPPEYSNKPYDIIDSRGVRTRVHPPPEPTDQNPVRDDRDRALLITYGSVQEIEDVRDRRAGYLESQNEVAQDRLDGLRNRRETLKDNPAAINELATVEQRIREYEAEIARRDLEIERIRGEFDTDIARYRELRGLD
jgi:hypothetical protein